MEQEKVKAEDVVPQSQEPLDEGQSKTDVVEPTKPKVRQDFYQTDSDIVVSLFLKNLTADQVNVEFSPESFRVRAKLPDGTHYENEVHLAKNIKPEQSAYKVMSSKVEIRLRKLDGGLWHALEAEKRTREFLPVYPSSSIKKFDWDKMEKEIEQQEKDDPDADVNSLFSKIYAAGDENTRKAMIKSMQESGGTVLSTNWDEVAKKHVDISPPDGLEFKSWTS